MYKLIWIELRAKFDFHFSIKSLEFSMSKFISVTADILSGVHSRQQFQEQYAMFICNFSSEVELKSLLPTQKIILRY